MECKKDVWDCAGRSARATTRIAGMGGRAKRQTDHTVRLGSSGKKGWVDGRGTRGLGAVKHAGFSGRSERFHAAAMSRDGGERSWIWAAVHLSTTIIGPPQLRQVQRGLGCLAAETTGSICGCGSALSTCRQSGSRVDRRRLARKPKLRMRTKPFGRCSKKRHKKSSSGKVISFC